MTLNRTLAIAFGFTALLGAAVVQAAELHQVQVPFAFEAAGQKMDAGAYDVVQQNGGQMYVRNEATGRGVFFMPVPVGPAGIQESKLTFHCYGSRCFLNKIEFGSTQVRYELRTSEHEKEIALDEKPRIMLIAMR